MFTATQAQHLAGVSYRKLDYWVRLGIVIPTDAVDGSNYARSVAQHNGVATPGSGYARRFDINELFVLCVIAALMDLKAGTDIAGRVADWLRMTNAVDPIERRNRRSKLYIDTDGFVLDDPAVALCYCIDLDVIRAKLDERAAALATA